MAHCETFLKRDGPRTPTAIHGASGLTFYPSEKANAIADFLEIQFTPHDLERWVEARVDVLFDTVDDSTPRKYDHVT
jgi:hypothetical protein